MPDADHDSHRDQDLVALLESGAQSAAFEGIVERYEAKIYRLCCALIRDRGLAEDAAQESLLRIWKGLGGYDRRASLSTWIYAITRNRCLTALERRRGADLESPVEWAEVPGAAGIETDDRAALLRELVDALPEGYRRALVLYYYEERSLGEAALMLGIPEGTLKTKLFRARARLLERLEKMGLSDAGHWLESA